MNKLLRIAGLLSFCIGASFTSFGQATATASCGATIITPIGLVKIDDLNFGNLSVQSGLGGTLVLTPDGTRTVNGAITLPANSGVVSSAQFSVEGADGFGFDITLPESILLTRVSGTEQIIVNNFSTSLGADRKGQLNGGGTKKFTVGATINVAAGQAPGVYRSDDLNITVNYY